ncbi:hypothetical protein GC175_00930 [bacterium]|nr:hypothetical protein [bacterium]
MLYSFRLRWAMVVLVFSALWPVSAEASPEAATDLGDVGYYYSQVGPFLESTISVFNAGVAADVAELTLRNDVGMVVYTQTQTIAAGEQWHFSPGDVGLRGIFHGDVRSEDDALSVFVSTSGEQDTSLRGGYVAVPVTGGGESLILEQMVVAGGAAPRDVEIVVQNLSARSNQVIFTLCPEDGRCFANNAAVLPANGRRTFLLSQLAHSNRYGDELVALTGRFSVTLASEPGRTVAALVNGFEPVTARKAELGAGALAQQVMTKAATPLSVVEGNSTIPQLSPRLYLPSIDGAHMPLAARRCPLPEDGGEWPCGAQRAGVWHLPFVAAPNLPFVDESGSLLGVGYPWQGIQATARSLDDWAGFSNLNWYNWRANADWDTRLNNTMWSLCEQDPHYFPMVWSAAVSRNTVPSSCAGRPLLLVNEPMLQRLSVENGGGKLDSWSDDAIATNVFVHQSWPGDLYCCGHVYWPNDGVDKISSNSTTYPTFGNVVDAYQQRFDAPLPIDGVHLHFYLWPWHVNLATQSPTDASLQSTRAGVRSWVTAIEDKFGEGFPILVSEYGILLTGQNQQAQRNTIKAGLDELTEVLIDELDDNLVRLHYFQVYWGGDTDPLRPMWLVGSDDGAYAVDEINDLGSFYLEMVEQHKR